jgi:regulator of protease activity HflC (stomatin/prohibitin superfamily)
MEKQMRAEREKRAVILTSEGQRDAAINSAEGEKQQVIKASEANRQQQINEAEGQAQAILAVASDRGREQFGNLARSTNSVIVPATVSDLAGMVAAAMKTSATCAGPQVDPPAR